MYSRNLSRVNISLQRNYMSPDVAASLPLPGYRTSLSLSRPSLKNNAIQKISGSALSLPSHG